MNTLFNNNNPQGKVTYAWSHNPPGELAAWSKCYQYSAQKLTNNILQSPDFVDRDAFPIIFLYRHALELCLKALLLEVTALYKLEGEEPPFKKNILGKHNLTPLIEPLNVIFSRFQSRFSSKCNNVLTYNEATKVVQEFDQLDSQSFAFRYPLDKSFKVAVLPHALDFSIVEFVKRIDPVLETLHDLIHSVDIESDFSYEQQFWENVE